MKKQEYIEKFGQEAWNIKKEQKNAWQRKRRKDNPDYDKKWRAEHPYTPPRKYDKAYYIEKYGEEYWQDKLNRNKKPQKELFIEKYGEEAWEDVLARGRKWKADHKDQHLSGVNKWQDENPDKVKAYKTAWKKNHPIETRAQNLCDAYKSADASEGRGDCTLTKAWIMEHIFTSRCIYCGDSNWEHLGADRIDNNLPHTPDNVVCSCGICNVERSDRYTVAEFVEYRRAHPRECDKVKTDTPLVGCTE